MNGIKKVSSSLTRIRLVIRIPHFSRNSGKEKYHKYTPKSNHIRYAIGGDIMQYLPLEAIPAICIQRLISAVVRGNLKKSDEKSLSSRFSRPETHVHHRSQFKLT